MASVALLLALGGRAHAADWTPAEIPSTTNVLWLDAADASTITEVSGAVSEWRDKSTNDAHAANASADNQPLTATHTIDGKNVIRFDGNDTLETLGGAAGCHRSRESVPPAVGSNCPTRRSIIIPFSSSSCKPDP